MPDWKACPLISYFLCRYRACPKNGSDCGSFLTQSNLIRWGLSYALDRCFFVCTINCTGGVDMEAMTYTAARQNLAKTMEKVCSDHAPVIVTRKTSNSVVIMSLEDYEALEETAYLLRSPKNTRRLIESIAQLENEKGTEKELIE